MTELEHFQATDLLLGAGGYYGPQSMVMVGGLPTMLLPATDPEAIDNAIRDCWVKGMSPEDSAAHVLKTCAPRRQ